MEKGLEDLSQRLQRFAEERDWEQFHAPKNLVMALSVEAAELLEHFQWLSEAQSAALSDDKRHAVSLEMADVFIYLLRLSQRLDIDLLAAAEEKMLINEAKYPAEQVRGSAKKYNEY